MTDKQLESSEQHRQTEPKGFFPALIGYCVDNPFIVLLCVALVALLSVFCHAGVAALERRVLSVYAAEQVPA